MYHTWLGTDNSVHAPKRAWDGKVHPRFGGFETRVTNKAGKLRELHRRIIWVKILELLCRTTRALTPVLDSLLFCAGHFAASDHGGTTPFTRA